MAEWGAQLIVSPQNNDTTVQICQKQPFQDSGNRPKLNNKLRSI